MQKKKAKPNRGGRPPAKINLKRVETLAAVRATDEEIGAALGVSRATIARRKETPAFKAAVECGRHRGLCSLRRAQFKAALKGNITMQIWLGKQYLGQKDVVKTEHSGSILIRRYEGVDVEQV